MAKQNTQADAVKILAGKGTANLRLAVIEADKLLDIRATGYKLVSVK